MFSSRKEASSKYLRIKEQELEMQDQLCREEVDLKRLKVAQRDRELAMQEKMFQLQQEEKWEKDIMYYSESCLNPGSLDFDMKIKEGRSGGFKGIKGVSGKLLVLAAEISNVSMRNAVVAAHNDAVNRGKEAVYAWKMAREAVVRVENMKYDHRIVIAGNGNGNDNGNGNGNRNGRGVDTNVVSEALNAVNLAGEAVSNNLKSDEDEDYDDFAEQIESELLDSEESPKNNCRWSIGLSDRI
nr:hypothetical protein CTI12_AA541800 [Tanacetum cinerariifolium]